MTCGIVPGGSFACHDFLLCKPIGVLPECDCSTRLASVYTDRYTRNMTSLTETQVNPSVSLGYDHPA